MPLYDYKCKECGVFEKFGQISDESAKCKCGKKAKRIISGGQKFNDDAEWIRSIVEVTDKESDKPATREFLRNPNRTNLGRMMKAEGIRHMEPGEKPINRQEMDVRAHSDAIMKLRQERRAISI